jgi:subtilisin family serine protease
MGRPRPVQTRLLTVLVASALAAASLLAGPGAARQAKKSEPRAGELIVVFKESVPEAEQQQVLAKAAAKEEKKLGKALAKLAKTDPAKLEYALKVLNADPRVRFAEPNYEVSIDALTPNDTSFGQLWGLKNTGQTVEGVAGTADADIDADDAWSVTTGSRSVVVAVIDTGVDFSHPDLGGSATASPLMWTNPGESCSGCKTDGVDNDHNGYIDDWRGWDFANNDNNPFDDNEHGTHVAGTIGAQGNNGVGVTGVNWNVTIMAVKFLDAAGSGTTADAVAAIRYAASFGVPISNNSWGSTAPSQALGEAIADEQGMLVVAASGNSGVDSDVEPHYPSSYMSPNVLSVAATTSRDQLATFSNFGDVSVDLAAPGASILSTIPGGGYAYFDGTSMATPHVAGAAALAKARFPGATVPGLKSLLMGTVDAKAALSGRVATGGRLNVFSAVSCSATPKLVIDQPGAGFTADVGDATNVTLIATNCASTGASVSATANGSPIALAARGDGVYTGSFTPIAEGPVTVSATATAGSSVTRSVSGTVARDYAMADGTFAWIDPTAGGTRLTSAGDDTQHTVTLPFAFPFYGTNYSSVKVSSNGYLVFGSSAATSFIPTPIPTSGAPDGLVAPLWDDLYPPGGGGIWHRTTGSAPNRKFVVGWIGIPHWFGNAATFEVILEEGTNAIVFQYQDTSFGNPDLDNGASGTVGVENLAGTVGEQFLHAESRLVGYPNAKSIRFTYGSGGGGSDTTPPDTTITAGPSGTVPATTGTFEFTSTEPNSTFQCSLDGVAYAGCTSPKSYSGLSPTSHTFRVRATDAAGNTDQSPAERTWTVSSGGGSGSSCSRSGATVSVTLASGAAATIGRSGTSIAVNGLGLGDPSCGGATVSNTDTINVQGGGGNESLTIDLAAGAFAPGVTTESSGTSEIEFVAGLGAGTDQLTVIGSSAADKLRLGTTGAGLNGDSDADVTISGVETYRLAGAGGSDALNAAGGSGTGTALTAGATLEGGDGNDTLTSGLGSDAFVGGVGTDTVVYTSTAALTVTIDGAANDGAAGEGDNVGLDVERVTAGSGSDSVTGSAAVNILKGGLGNDTVTGGLGADTLNGGGGNDRIEARDGVVDTVTCGSGTDTVIADTGDSVNSDCETVSRA